MNILIWTPATKKKSRRFTIMQQQGPGMKREGFQKAEGFKQNSQATLLVQAAGEFQMHRKIFLTKILQNRKFRRCSNFIT